MLCDEATKFSWVRLQFHIHTKWTEKRSWNWLRPFPYIPLLMFNPGLLLHEQVVGSFGHIFGGEAPVLIFCYLHSKAGSVHFLTIMDGFDNEDEQAVSLQGSNAQLLDEVMHLQKNQTSQTSQQDLIDKLQVAYFGLINQNILLQEITFQLHATIKSSQDLVSQIHDELEEKNKCILSLQRLNRDLVRQVSELRGTEDIPEDCINTLPISSSSFASTPALVAIPELHSPDNGDFELWARDNMLPEVTQPLSQAVSSLSLGASSHSLMDSLVPSPPNFEQCT